MADPKEVVAEVTANERWFAAGVGGATQAYMTGIMTAIAAAGQYARLHIATPGNNGASPSLAPVVGPITWVQTGGAGADIQAVATLTFTIPANATAAAIVYTHFGIYNAVGAAAGNFLYGKALSANVTQPVGASATVTVTVTHTYAIS